MDSDEIHPETFKQLDESNIQISLTLGLPAFFIAKIGIFYNKSFKISLFL